MSDLEARQARPATPPMTKHHGPVVPPGREMRPKPVQKEKQAMQKETPPLSQNARMVLSQLDHNGPQTGVELSKATGLSQGSVSTALKALREAGEVTSKKTSLNGGAIINTSTAWATKEIEVEVKRRKDDERFDEDRADAIGQNGNDGAHYGAEVGEDSAVDLSDEHLPIVEQAQHPSPIDGDSSDAYIARDALAKIWRCIGRMETDSQTGIAPLPENDNRVTALRRLVPMVSDDIGAALSEVLDRVTGKEAA